MEDTTIRFGFNFIPIIISVIAIIISLITFYIHYIRKDSKLNMRIISFGWGGLENELRLSIVLLNRGNTDSCLYRVFFIFSPDSKGHSPMKVRSSGVNLSKKQLSLPLVIKPNNMIISEHIECINCSKVFSGHYPLSHGNKETKVYVGLCMESIDYKGKIYEVRKMLGSIRILDGKIHQIYGEFEINQVFNLFGNKNQY